MYNRDFCRPIFVPALLTIAKLWDQSRCHQRMKIKEMWYMYTIECYSAIKKNEIKLFAGKWMELEIVMLNEIRQSHKDKYLVFLLICEI
jgi:hypothetical protein